MKNIDLDGFLYHLRNNKVKFTIVNNKSRTTVFFWNDKVNWSEHVCQIWGSGDKAEGMELSCIQDFESCQCDMRDTVKHFSYTSELISWALTSVGVITTEWQ